METRLNARNLAGIWREGDGIRIRKLLSDRRAF